MSSKKALAKRNGNGGHAPIQKKTTAEHALDFGKAWDYAPAPESPDHVKLKSRYELFIGGKWVKPQSKKYFETISPSTEQKIADIAEADAADVDAAVVAARKAHDKYWAKMPGAERAKYIFRIARALQEKARELAIVESMEDRKSVV